MISLSQSHVFKGSRRCVHLSQTHMKSRMSIECSFNSHYKLLQHMDNQCDDLSQWFMSMATSGWTFYIGFPVKFKLGFQAFLPQLVSTLMLLHCPRRSHWKKANEHINNVDHNIRYRILKNVNTLYFRQMFCRLNCTKDPRRLANLPQLPAI